MFIIAYFICVYSIMVSAALMGVEKSNEWSISYFTAYCADTFMFENLSNFLVVSILRYEIILG